MDRIELPVCRWRGSELQAQVFGCHSPKVHAPKGVPAKLCAGCFLADHEPPEPSLSAKARNFAGAVARHVANGMRKVSEEEYQRRLSLCLACPWWKDGACAKCGCPVAGDKRAKARWASERCPLDPPKW